MKISELFKANRKLKLDELPYNKVNSFLKKYNEVLSDYIFTEIEADFTSDEDVEGSKLQLMDLQDEISELSDQLDRLVQANSYIHDEDEMFDFILEVGFEITDIYDYSLEIETDGHYELDVIRFDKNSRGNLEVAFGNSDDAERSAIDSVKSLIDDIGVTGFNGWENHVEEGWFRDAEEEFSRSYAEDIASESPSDDSKFYNRLHEEIHEAGISIPTKEDDDFDEDDVLDYIDDFVEHRMGDISDFVEHYVFNFGEEALNEVVKNNYLVDENKFAISIANDDDGYGHHLSTYDGYTNDFDSDIYWFTINK